MKLTPRTRVLLLVTLLAGAALRLFRLGADSLWYDETVSAYLAGSSLPELLRHTANDIHPPLYYLLLRGWLILTGYGTGRADPTGIGLEFTAGFFSLCFGVLLIALIFALARRIGGLRIALIASILAALSPFNVWYSQEVRMYTLGAALGVVVVVALLRSADCKLQIADHRSQIANRKWWAVYALAAAAGMYTLYYFAFLLIPLNLWALARLGICHRVPRAKTDGNRAPIVGRFADLPFAICRLTPLLLANLAAALLYAPWAPIAYRQAVDPPVPPWRTAPALLKAVGESWQALSLGQSAPGWLWPALVLTLALFGLGMCALAANQRTGKSANQQISKSANQHSAFCILHSAFLILPIATFGPLLLILLVSLVTPLYHVRYLFIYSPAFYIVMAAGVAWLWQRRRGAAIVGGVVWLAAAAVTLHAFWFDPRYRADDHRAAVRDLQSRWQPGDVALVNAGYAYPPLYTYWQGPIADRIRLTEQLPRPRSDDALALVTTGHVDGAPGLGWGDPRSDFFALPAEIAEAQLGALSKSFGRVWQYRIYDTVNDPQELIRSALDRWGQPIEDRLYGGEANMRLQGFTPRAGVVWSPEWPAYRYSAGMSVQFDPAPIVIQAGQLLHHSLIWRAGAPPVAEIAISLRLIGADGQTWAQPPDMRPMGPLFRSSQWPTGVPQRQPFSLEIPAGTPPGAYTLALLVYDPKTGAPSPPQDYREQVSGVPNGLNLTQVTVLRGDTRLQSPRAQFGPVALVAANSPATTVSPGGEIPVELLWQAVEPPREPLVVVVQLLGAQDQLVANLEEAPVQGRYPTQGWTATELVRDRHTLRLPPALTPGDYRLIVGIYRAADRVRLKTRAGLFIQNDYWVIKTLQVR